MNKGEYGIGGWTGTASAGSNIIDSIKASVLSANPNSRILMDSVPGIQKATICAAAGSTLSINGGPPITMPSSGVLDIPFGTVFIRSIVFAVETADVNIIYVY